MTPLEVPGKGGTETEVAPAPIMFWGATHASSDHNLARYPSTCDLMEIRERKHTGGQIVRCPTYLTTSPQSSVYLTLLTAAGSS